MYKVNLKIGLKTKNTKRDPNPKISELNSKIGKIFSKIKKIE